MILFIVSEWGKETVAFVIERKNKSAAVRDFPSEGHDIILQSHCWSGLLPVLFVH